MSNVNNKGRERPISPHLTIYKPQISSVLSAMHRISGIGLFIVLIYLCWWFILWVFSRFEISYLECFNYFLVKAVLFITSYGYFYHFSNGIRHLLWDTGKFFTIGEVNLTGWVAVFSSIILTLIFWIFI